MVGKRIRTVLITGCSEGGIGDALAQEFYRRGLSVFASARNLAKIRHLESLGINTVELDVSDRQSIQHAVNAVTEITGGALDILVNNAGAGYGAPLAESDLDLSRQMFEANFFGRAAVTQAFIPALIRSKGTIINIGSIAAVYPGVWQGMYSASCAAQHQWSDVLRIELEPFGVKVVLVVTGAVTTNFLDNKPGNHLRQDSLYTPVREEVEAMMDGSVVKGNFVPAEGYAKSVVDNALKASPTLRFWAGGVVNAIWFASTFLWATVWVWNEHA